MPSFLDMFKPQPAATPAPATPGTGKIADVVPQVTAVPGQGTVPDNTASTGADTPVSPLDQFKTLWENDPNAKPPAGNYVPETIDPAKLQEVMGKVDLRNAITPEIQAAIAGGGDGATVALMEAMNLVAQQTLVQSTMVANKMQEQNIIKTQQAILAQLPKLLKEQNLTTAVQAVNPAYTNPAVAPVIDALKSQLATKFPDATTADLTKMTQDFVAAFGATLNPAPAAPAIPNEQDFSGWENQ